MRIRTSYIIVNYKLCFLILVIIFVVWVQLYWIASFIVLGLASYWILKRLISTIRFDCVQYILKWAVKLLYFFLLIIAIKIFFVDIYKIPSTSMEKTLFSGDIIAVNKWVYGPLIPHNLEHIPWLNLFSYLSKNPKTILNKPLGSYNRLNGIRQIKQGDILVYEFAPSFFVVKRCVAVAGDEFQIANGIIYTDKKQYRDSESVKNTYIFETTQRNTFYHDIDSLGLGSSILFQKDSKNLLRGSLTLLEKEKVNTISGVSDFRLVNDTTLPKSEFFVTSTNIPWTLNNLGPIKVPQKGMSISLNSETYALYSKTIEKYEEIDLIEKFGKYYANGVQIKKYTFTKDYYFMMGDNRYNSYDSRYVGFIPKESIIGKVSIIIYSISRSNNFRWKRVLKLVVNNRSKRHCSMFKYSCVPFPCYT